MVRLPLFHRAYSRVYGGAAQPEHAAKGYCPRVPGVRMPATYINHYAANGGAVVPQFGGWAAETDALAIKTLQATALILGTFETLIKTSTQQHSPEINPRTPMPKRRHRHECWENPKTF